MQKIIAQIVNHLEDFRIKDILCRDVGHKGVRAAEDALKVILIKLHGIPVVKPVLLSVVQLEPG